MVLVWIASLDVEEKEGEPVVETGGVGRVLNSIGSASDCSMVCNMVRRCRSVVSK